MGRKRGEPGIPCLVLIRERTPEEVSSSLLCLLIDRVGYSGQHLQK